MVQHQVEIILSSDDGEQQDCVRSQWPDSASALILYGENSSGSNSQLLASDSEGLDVYVRKRSFNE